MLSLHEIHMYVVCMQLLLLLLFYDCYVYGNFTIMPKDG